MMKTQAGVPWLARGWPDPPKRAAMIQHAFPLRPSGLYSRCYLELPDDMTAAEAERVIGYVRALSLPAPSP